MLTKEQIEIIRWVVNVDDVHFSERAVAELRRLALLGLEVETEHLSPEPAHETALDVFEATRAMRGRATAAVLGAAAQPAPAFDERAEKIGKLVLELWGTDPAQLRWQADHRARLGRIDSTTDDPQAVLLLRGVADILETTDA